MASPRSGGKDADARPRDSVEVGCCCQKLGAGVADGGGGPGFHGRIDRYRRRAQPLVLRQPITFQKPCEVPRLAWWTVRKHRTFIEP